MVVWLCGCVLSGGCGVRIGGLGCVGVMVVWYLDSIILALRSSLFSTVNEDII